MFADLKIAHKTAPAPELNNFCARRLKIATGAKKLYTGNKARVTAIAVCVVT